MGEQTDSIRLALTLLPLLALACWVMTRSRNKPLWFLVLLAAGVATFLLEREQRLGLAAAYGIPHAAIYLFLLWFFGHTLWRAKEPLVTRLARRVHGTLSAGNGSVHTRRDLRLVCVFCGSDRHFSIALRICVPQCLVAVYQRPEFSPAGAHVRW
jgi:hypothetical protein